MSGFSVIFEDEEIFVINKDSGYPVQGGAGISHSLDDDLSKQAGYRVHLVHRLDKDTAGLMIVAKDGKSAAKWTKLIQSKAVKKEYDALCFGTPLVKGKKADKGILTSTVDAHGRTQEAQTFFEVKKQGKITFEDEEKTSCDVSLVHLTLGTGRMHQIRIQMAKAMCPLCGDDQHGNFKLNKKLRKLGGKKLCLASVRLTLPVEGKDVVFESPLPSHMQCIENLI